MSARVLVPISEGFEEIEFSTIVDVLRRAECQVTVASVQDTTAPVTGRSRIAVVPDTTLDDAAAQAPYDAIVLPGGLPNAFTLRDDPRIQRLLQEHHRAQRQVAAICAAPSALAASGVLDGAQQATIYPGLRDQLGETPYTEDPVAVSGNVTTSRGPATAMAFALTLAARLRGQEVARSVAADLLASYPD